MDSQKSHHISTDLITCENFEYVKKKKNQANISTEKKLSNHFEPTKKKHQRWKK